MSLFYHCALFSQEVYYIPALKRAAEKGNGEEKPFSAPARKEVHSGGGRHHAAPIICRPEQKGLAIREGEKIKNPSSSPVSASENCC
jgi:hypothetical protein